MIERKRKPAYLFIALGAGVSALLLYLMYEVSVTRAISAPTTEAAERTVNALDPHGVDTTDKKPELPVWPPPSHSAPLDPASNPMVGALPMHIDWPDGGGARPSSSTRR